MSPAKHRSLHPLTGRPAVPLGKLAAVTILLIGVGAAGLIVSFLHRHRDEPTKLGVSFSTKYAMEIGIDWQAAYRGIVEDLEFKRLRLMSYWDLHEPQNGIYDFSSLDWQFEQAERHGVKINLAVGERQPRWPECHHPAWAKELSKADLEKELFEYIGVVVKRYRDSPALEQYQLENEIFNRLFGECTRVERSRVQAEYDLIKELDPSHPIVINVSNQSGTPVRPPIGDKVGFSMYRKSHGKVLGFDIYWSFWYVPPQWHTLRAAVIELIHGVPTFVHELQTEPWGPKATRELSIATQNETMNSMRMREAVEFAEQTGMSEIYMWGAEWWYWRKVHFNDPEPWNMVRQLLLERTTVAE